MHIMDCENKASRKRAQRMSLGMCLGIALGAMAAAAGDAVAQAPPHVDPAISGSRDGWRREARNRSAPGPVQGQGALPAPPPGGQGGGAPPVPEFRTYDGSGNNVQHPLWGTPGVNYLRERSGARYADGKSAPAGANRPSARVISNALVAQGDISTADDRGLSTCLYEFGQFLDHDIGLAAGGFTEAFDISVPAGDPWFDPTSTGTKKIWMDRSAFNPATGINSPREQINTVTSFIDGSQIYGVDSARAAWLRAGTGGKLKVRVTEFGDMLPLNDGTMPNDDPLGNPVTSLVVAGDVRANEQPGLTSFQTVFLREHNLQANRIATRHPEWDDERVFQEARRIVIAELQAIVSNEFLPALLGRPLPRYAGYRRNVNPGLSNVFAAAAYRNGHSMVGPDIGVIDENFVEIDSLPLQSVFFNPGVIASVNGIDPIVRYFAVDTQQITDTMIVDPLRNFLFGPPGAGGFDLGAMNIQRGRDHGLPDYNTVRRDFGLKPVKTFAQITSQASVAASLASLYGNVNNIDAWVGMLAEDHLPGSSMGATHTAILRVQFTALRDGDRFWYQNCGFSPQQLGEIERTRLSHILMRNTGVTGLQDRVFFAADLSAP
jgi:peroxidase